MAIGERIHFFRIMRGMTQKYLGTLVGFPDKSADVRLAQYETGSRKPKADLTAALAQVLDVSPQAVSYTHLMCIRDSFQIDKHHQFFRRSEISDIWRLAAYSFFTSPLRRCFPKQSHIQNIRF